MALTANVARKTQVFQDKVPLAVNVAASTEIFKGAIVAQDASGNAIPAPAAQTSEFYGIATDYYDNSAGAITTDNPLIIESGQIEQLTLSTTPAESDLMKPVYYVDDASVTLTPPGDTTTRVGRIIRIVTGTTIMVDTNKDWRVQ